MALRGLATQVENNDPLMFGVSGQDFATVIRMTEERWRLHYPLVEYYPMDIKLTGVGQQTDTVSGTTGGTAIDPLWGEAVDSKALADGWQQPHRSAQVVQDPLLATAAAEPEVRGEVIKVNMRVQQYMHENMLKKLGFDQVRTTVCTVPTSQFERYKVIARPGDRFRWNAEWYEVLQAIGQGFVRNSTAKLYTVLSVQTARQGS